MIIDLKLKLSGQLPINRYELMEIVSSWGRNLNCHLYNQQDIQRCEPNECYPLENLDVSQIEDFSFIFYSSPYNGDKRFKNNNSLLFLNF